LRFTSAASSGTQYTYIHGQESIQMKNRVSALSSVPNNAGTTGEMKRAQHGQVTGSKVKIKKIIFGTSELDRGSNKLPSSSSFC
jgi:hypothetical protein